MALAAQKIATQNRSGHGGRKRPRDHLAAEIAGFLASPAANKLLAKIRVHAKGSYSAKGRVSAF